MNKALIGGAVLLMSASALAAVWSNLDAFTEDKYSLKVSFKNKTYDCIIEREGSNWIIDVGDVDLDKHTSNLFSDVVTFITKYEGKDITPIVDFLTKRGAKVNWEAL